jgi:phage-related holin
MYSFFFMNNNFSEIGASLVPWINTVYGEDRMLPLALLLVAIILDWITGMASSQKDTRYSQEYGKLGVLRTLFLLVLPMFAKLLDSMLGMPGLFFYAITIGLIYKTWQSLTVNAYRAGWGKWIPSSVIHYIDNELKGKTIAPSKEGGNAELNDETAADIKKSKNG